MTTRKNYTKDGEGHPKNLPTTKSEGHLSKDDMDLFVPAKQRDVNAGNTLIPRLAVLEANSPQLDRHAPEFIQGASAGMIADVALGEAWDGEKGILILPAYYEDLYIEWAPRDSGEGLVHNYLTDSRVYDSLAPDERQKRFLPNGNEVIKTGTLYCLNLSTRSARPCFFPLTSTRYQAAKQFNSMQIEDTIETSPGVFQNSALFYRTWHVSIFRREKKGNRWHVPKFEKGVPILEYDPSRTLARKAKAFGEQIEEQIRSGTIAMDLARESDDESEHQPRDKSKERM